MSGLSGIKGILLGYVALTTNLGLGCSCGVEFLASENLIKLLLDSSQPPFL